jgi:hypothetical protein
MIGKKQSTVVGVFPTVEQADAAIRDLVDKGFKKDDIGFIIREEGGGDVKREGQEQEQGYGPRVIEGGVTGGLLGGLFGSLAALAIPGFGPVLSVGLFASAGGALIGMFTGVMSNEDYSDDEIRWYHEELRAGRPIVAVHADGRYSEALAILQTHGAYDMTRQNQVQQEPATNS